MSDFKIGDRISDITGQVVSFLPEFITRFDPSDHTSRAEVVKMLEERQKKRDVELRPKESRMGDFYHDMTMAEYNTIISAIKEMPCQTS